jgi:hypothetical protein
VKDPDMFYTDPDPFPGFEKGVGKNLKGDSLRRPLSQLNSEKTWKKSFEK